MIDLHAHILPDLDDGAQTWDEALEMARLAVADGITTLVATPHLYRQRAVVSQEINAKETILEKISLFRRKLADAGIDLEILPGCDIPLCYEALQLLKEGRLLTINDNKRYLLLEMPDTAIPPATEEVCFQMVSRGITPIITHPERNFIFAEMPQKLSRLLDLGCLAQVTAQSLLGGFGRQVARFARQLLTQGKIRVMATDAHNTHRRPPLLREAVAELTRIVGKERAWEMVTATPEKIIKGEDL